MYATPELKIFHLEKIAIKLFLVLSAMTIFSGRDLSVNAYNNIILHGYAEINNFAEKEHENALFLSEKQWENELQKKYKTFRPQKITNGIFYVRIIKKINNRKIKINVAEINRNINKNLEIIPQLAKNKLHAKTGIDKIGEKTIIAVNGTYFKQNTGTPLGTLVINNEILTGPVYERVAFLIGENSFKLEKLNFSGTMRAKKKQIQIDNINQPRMSKYHTIIYTDKWGEKAPEYKLPLTYISISNKKIIKISDKPLNIPRNGVVIAGGSEYLKGFKTGQRVKINYKLSGNYKNFKHIISGGPFLIKDGKIFIDTAEEKLNAITGRNPRSAIGYTDDNVLIIVTVDGRKEGTDGVTLQELAKIMKDLKCTNAMNLDGGSSTVMLVNGKTIGGSNIKSAQISNALTVKIKDPV